MPAPLAVGVEGLAEVLELDLVEQMAPEELARTLGQELPEGLTPAGVEAIEPTARARVASVTYEVRGDLPEGSVDRCRAATTIGAVRPGGRRLNVRSYLRRLAPCDGGCEVEVLVTHEGTARPAEIASALRGGEEREAYRRLSFVRTAVTLEAP